MDKLLDFDRLKESQVDDLLNTSFFLKGNFSRIKEKKPLSGKNILLLFLEPSTRTKASFELACSALGANVIHVSQSDSSITKGETLENTLKTLSSYPIDALIIRDSKDDSAILANSIMKCPVINAGTGRKAHPTQSLSDMMTLIEKGVKLDELKICIVGDVQNSRVARSTIFGFTKMHSEVAICAPRYFQPNDLDMNRFTSFASLNDALEFADVIMALRIQNERLQGHQIDLNDYVNNFRITKELLKKYSVKFLLHPGPVNENVEIEKGLIDSKISLISDQVENGFWVRASVLLNVLGGGI